MVFNRIPGESVCNFVHTLRSFKSQLDAAEIRVPGRVQFERLVFLKERFRKGCLHASRDDDDEDD